MSEKQSKWSKICNWLMNWFFIPFLALLILYAFSKIISNNICKAFLTLGTGIYIILYLICLCVSMVKKFANKGLIISSIIILSFSVLTMWLNVTGISNMLFMIFSMLLELYLLISIFKYVNESKLNKYIAIILYSAIFVIYGYIAIYLFSYGKDNNDMFTSLITLFSSIIGGLLTLGGVAWTIVNENNKNKEEERKKFKPYIFLSEVKYNNLINYFSQKNDIRIFEIERLFVSVPPENENIYYLDSMGLRNSDFSHCRFKELIINDCVYQFESNFISKNDDQTIHIGCYVVAKDLNIKIVVEDLLGYPHTYQVEHAISKEENLYPWQIFDTSRMQPINNEPINIKKIKYTKLKEIIKK